MLKKELIEILIKRKLTISSAESLTGGLFASEIVSVADASKVFKLSLVTYSNEAKIEFLNVKEETILKYDVVSEEVAKEMVIGLFQKSKADICVSFTGNAGPSGNPVGKVCFGIYYLDEIKTYTYNFGNVGRNKVRKEAVAFMFKKLIELIK